MVEIPVPKRCAIIGKLLAERARRPAIVYAQSRKQSQELAAELSRTVPAAAYHAGLDAQTRERVQRAFQAGELEVVVATIAFGMGIDKADIRTVIHAGLPSTLEGYYQEIGRAGRDGKPSRTFLMHSYADQRTHDFLLSRDYPPTEHLQRVYRALTAEVRPAEVWNIAELRAASMLDDEEFDKALEKLQIHGGARVDFDGSATAGRPDWTRTYSIQAQYRREQLEKVLRFTEAQECRMAALVRHFGDVADARIRCGQCDVCDPAGAVLLLFRRATPQERHWVQDVIEALRGAAYKTVKGLRAELRWAEGMGRDEFEELLSAMTRTGILDVENTEFEKDGKVIPYRRITLTHSGMEVRSTTSLPLLMSDGVVEEFTSTPAARKPMPSRAKASSGSRNPEVAAAELSPESEALAGRLREWRSAEARRLRVPPYVVLHDRTLNAVARIRPENPGQLITIDGIGPAKAEKFGSAILELCAAGQE